MSVFGSKITVFLFFRPQTAVWRIFGRISVEILMAAIQSRRFFGWPRRRRRRLKHFDKLFYKLELLLIHVTVSLVRTQIVSWLRQGSHNCLCYPK